MTLSRLVRIARQRWRSLTDAGTQDADLDRELAFHLEQLAREKMAEGLPDAPARQAARREFGNLALFQERSRDEWRLTWIRDLRQDAACAWRMLAASPGFTTTAIVSLALGIGATSAVSGALKAVFIARLPFAEADRLVSVRPVKPGAPVPIRGATLVDYFAWQERNRTLEAVGASLSSPRQIGPDPDGTAADRVASEAFTPSLFAMLGVPPERGRLFDEASSAYSPAARVVVISHRLWQQRYGGAPDVLGRSMRVDGALRTIVGVMPATFQYHDDNVDCWIPLIPGPDARHDAGSARMFIVTARLRAGVTIGQAQADLARIEDELAREFPDRFRGWEVRVVGLRESMYAWTTPRLFTLWAAVALLWFTACANIAGLLLARGSARHRELWVRVSLGAGRGRIIRQLLTESLMLALAGGAAGLLVAVLALHALSAAMGPPPGLPHIDGLGLDATLSVLTLVLSVLSAAGFGVLPALAVTAAVPSRAEAVAGSAMITDRRGHRQRSVLVAAQIALAAVLLVGAGLLLNSFVRLTHRDLNFDPNDLVTFAYHVDIPDYARLVGQDADGLRAFDVTPAAAQAIARVYDRLRAVPGVESVAGISYPPVNSLTVPRFGVRPVSAPGGPGSDADAPLAAYFLVTPGFFSAMRTPVVRGREIGPGDLAGAPPVVVINEAAARRFWPDTDAIGRCLTLDMDPAAEPREVVGIVRDVPVVRGEVVPEPVVYGAVRQPPAVFRGKFIGMFGEMTFLLRHTGDASATLAAARRAVAEVDPNRPLVNVGQVRRALDGRLPETRNYAAAVGLFGFMALLLASVGVYGITAFSVAQRAREVGIRRALGAGRRDIVAVVGGRALVLIGSGLAAGLAVAFALTRLISAQLWGIAPTDPATYLAAAGTLAVVAVAACLVPARRALTVDPVTVLRCE